MLQKPYRFGMLLCLAVGLLGSRGWADSETAADWQSLFDGQSLHGWDGDPRFWSVQDGVITGTTTPAEPTQGNTFLIYVGDSQNKTPVEFANFELKVEYRIQNHNSGVQYRSFLLPNAKDRWRVGGYQADIDADNNWSGTNYGEQFRGILAKRSERVTLSRNELQELQRQVESIGNPAELAKAIKAEPEWNEYHIIAKGFTLTQKINGTTMSEVIDSDEKERRTSGLLAIQLHSGPAMKIEVRRIKIKKLMSE